MKVLSTRYLAQSYIKAFKNQEKTIGFVPTMGALHEGHLSLIRKAKANNDVVVVSIFVNPTQFNNPKDLERYPKTLEEDLKKLEHIHCDAVFTPNTLEMYAKDEKAIVFNFKGLDKEMEGIVFVLLELNCFHC